MKILLSILAAQLTFCIFFLAIRLFSIYILPRQPKPTKTMTQNKLKKLIDSTNGKFFSLEFKKLDGTVKRVNGKDFYRRLLSDGPKAGWNPLQGTSFTPFVDRNKEDWSSASDSRLIRFKCGAIEETF